MAISIFPSTAAEFVSNNFVVDMNDTSNNTADTGGVKQAGPYSISLSSGDSSFDVYFVDEEGNSVGYSNNTSIVATGLFTTVVIFGVAQDEVVSFLYQGSVNNADGEGDEPGAGAYLESISPTDLPTIDDTATVTGGNFGADTEIYFDSGQTSLEAKNITVNNSTELIVTRPDNLDANLDPWDLRAVNTGIPEPTGSNAHILVDGVTAGDSPVWTTTSPLPNGLINSSYTVTLEATDPDGGAVTYEVTTGSLPAGLSLNSSTGEISGTPTAGQAETFTVSATDNGGSTTTREFDLNVLLATGGDSITVSGGTATHIFENSGELVAGTSFSAEYVVVGGGGGGGQNERFDFTTLAGAGGAGGYRSSYAGDSASGGGATLESPLSITAGTIPVTVGAGGTGGGPDQLGIQGGNSTFSTITSLGGGVGGGEQQGNPTSGGSGGGGAAGFGQTGASGTTGQGFKGGDSSGSGGDDAGGGGGATSAGGTGQFNSGDGITSDVTGTSLLFAEGGFPRTTSGTNPSAFGGGGLGISPNSGTGRNGQDGIVVVRYAL